MIKVLLCALCLSLSSSLVGQHDPIEDFLNAHEGFRKYYVYQSTLRLLNREGNPDFDKCIRNLRKVNMYVAKKGRDTSRAYFQAMTDILKKDSYEMYLQASNGTGRIQLMARGDQEFVLTGMEGDMFAILEMDGRLNLEYLQAIRGIDVTRLAEIVNTGPGFEN